MPWPKFTPDRVRIAVIGGATLLAAGVIGTTAALATSAVRGVHDEADLAASDGRLLTLRTATPAPLAMPGPPSADGQLAVLADTPVDLVVDPSLESSRDLALIRQADAVQAHDAQVQAALWASEEARMQSQIDAAMRPSSAPMDGDGGDPAVPTASARAAGDPEITASAGDTRKA